jgi:hypothetical protein
MKKSEKIIAALLTMALGILFIILKDAFIALLMTIAGVSLIVLGIIALVNKLVPPAVVKIVAGSLVVLCGWVIVEAVLYILAAILLIFGILLLYYNIKNNVRGCTLWETILEYATPSICIAIGILLLFHTGAIVNFVFIASGVLAFLEGCIMLYEALINP